MKGVRFQMRREEEFRRVCEKYPDVPRPFILKSDLLRRGVTFSKTALNRIMDPSSYYDTPVRLLFQWHQQDNEEPYDLPDILCFNDGTQVCIRVSPPEVDPYSIDFMDDKFWIMSNGEPLEEIEFLKRPIYKGKMTTKGVPMDNILFFKGDDCLLCVPYRYCQYWTEGTQCLFCDLGYNTILQKKRGKAFKVRLDPEEIYETFVEALKEKGRYREICLTGGSDPRRSFDEEFRFYLRTVSAIKDAYDVYSKGEKPPVMILMTPLEEDKYEKLYEAGVSAVGAHLEVWNKEKFGLVCPGKEKHVGYDNWINRMANAVKVFGEWRVNCSSVIGVQMAPPPYGFGVDADMDRIIEEEKEGWKFLLDKAIAPCFLTWSVEPGSALYEMGVTQPPLEFYVKLEREYYRTLKEFETPHASYMCYRDNSVGLSSDWERLI